MLDVGIEAITCYTSPFYLNLTDLAKHRGIDPKHFCQSLGQEKMAVCGPDEDVVTMAAEAAARLITQENKSTIGMVILATETGVDHSKAASLFLLPLLELPKKCRFLEVKQACYGLTGTLQLVTAFIRANPEQKILLIASDIAKYGLCSKAESSQGGGAVAMLLSADPRILVLETETGYIAEDAADFWRPYYKTEAIVNGKYSCDVYLRLLQEAWQHYTHNSGRAYDQHHVFCYHVPVPKLAETAHKILAKKAAAVSLTPAEVAIFMQPALRYNREIGNCYTASLYLSLCSLLENETADLTEKRALMYSYGSGSIAEVFSVRIQPGYRQYLAGEYHQSLLNKRRAISVTEYEQYHKSALPEDGSCYTVPQYKAGCFRLAHLNGHQRIYAKTTSAV